VIVFTLKKLCIHSNVKNVLKKGKNRYRKTTSKTDTGQESGLMPVILATQEAEIRRITV
jgi:hypothetical protein